MSDMNTKGFTLMELLISLGFVGIFASIIAGIFSPLVFNPKGIAANSANNYISKAEVAGVDTFTLLDCMSNDNDGDGKVSCTVVNQKTKQRQLLLCESTIWAKFMGGSCADPKPFTINNPQ
jgi:prepilin-type N-terminal cleavage/methylation domain-containing protein